MCHIAIYGVIMLLSILIAEIHLCYFNFYFQPQIPFTFSNKGMILVFFPKKKKKYCSNSEVRVMNSLLIFKKNIFIAETKSGFYACCLHHYKHRPSTLIIQLQNFQLQQLTIIFKEILDRLMSILRSSTHKQLLNIVQIKCA